MKNIIRLNKKQLDSLVNQLLSEQFKNPTLNAGHFKKSKPNFYKDYIEHMSDGVYTDFDRSYDYKLYGGVWSAKRKNGTKWIDLTDYPKAIKILTQKLEQHFDQPYPKPNPKVNDDKVDPLNSPFKNKIQGNLFRKFVDKYYTNIGIKFKLDLSGPFNSPNIIKSANEIVTSKTYGKIKLSDLFFKLNKEVKLKGTEPGETLPSLLNTGFKIDRSSFENNLGYFVRKCTQKGCAEFTYDMIGNVFGDAWQAYSKFQQYANVTPDLVKKMTYVFNSINKMGMPTLNDVSVNDSKSKNIITSLIPSDQKQFNNLPLGAVVGLYYPDSSNFDLAFFQSAIGMSRDNAGKWVQVKRPYFCKQQDKCDSTLWKQNDENKNINFKPNDTLQGGKSFIPNTHIGFVGYIDSKGERYVVHNVHQSVFAFPVSKMNKNTLSIMWAGTPKIK